MSEIYTPTPEEQKLAPEQQAEDDFAIIQEMQNDKGYQQEAAARAQRIIEQSQVSPVEATKNHRNKTTIGLAAGAVLVAGLGSGLAIADHVAPSETIASATGTVAQGEGLIDAVDSAIGQLEAKGVDPADINNRQDVISQAVEFYTDQSGVVQPGTNVKVIVKETPIFHVKTYEAAPKESENNQ